MNNENFTPLAANHGNIDANISHFRDTFLRAEIEYFKALMVKEKNREVFTKLLDYPPEMLFKEAMNKIKLVEYGMVKEEELEDTEAEITFMLAAIQDKVHLLELVRTMEVSQEGYSRGR